MPKLKYFLPYISLTLIMIASFALMLNSSRQESAVIGELASIPFNADFANFKINLSQPPLIKTLGELPLLFRSNNEQSDFSKTVNRIRVIPMVLTIILILFAYIWAKELLGKWWALMPAALTAFSPAFLAYGHYATADIAAALAIFITFYYFVKFIEQNHPAPFLKEGVGGLKNLFFSGAAFGAALLLEFSAILLIPFFLFLILAYAILKTNPPTPFLKRGKGGFVINFGAKIFGFLKEFFKHFGYLILIILIGYLIVCAAYFAFDSQNYLRPLGEYFLEATNFWQNSANENTSLHLKYFLGQVSIASANNPWYYYPAIFSLKEPLPSLAIIALAISIGLFKFIKNTLHTSLKQRFFNYLELNFAEFSMISFIVFYWIYIIVKNPSDPGIRHILPPLPFIYILSSGTLKIWVRKKLILSDNFIKNAVYAVADIIKISLKSTLIFTLIIWYVLETLISAPYFISYFNEFGGGTENGYKYATDSNYDWGQDLKRLKKFIDNPPAGETIEKIAVDYYGGGDTRYYLGDASAPLSAGKAISWQSSKNNPRYEGINWIAISISTLQNATGKLAIDQSRNPEDEYQWLQKIKDIYRPDYRVGTSIFVYKLN